MRLHAAGAFATRPGKSHAPNVKPAQILFQCWYNHDILFSLVAMRRLLILCLMFLLPLQAFAGMVGDHLTCHQKTAQSSLEHTGVANSGVNAATELGIQNVLDISALMPETLQNYSQNGSQDTGSDDSAEEFAGHAPFGDDAVPASFLVFALYAPPFISSLHDDAASVPPFLPPAARPPKI
jgi:hypothetical protein